MRARILGRIPEYGPGKPVLTGYFLRLPIAIILPIWAVGMGTVQSFNGAGDTKTPTWINLFLYWIFQLPLAWLFGWPLGMVEDGIFWAVAAAQLVLAVIAAILFRRGKWKKVVV